MDKIGEHLYYLWELIWYGYVIHFWDWFWYYRRGKIKFTVYDFGDYYNVSASNGRLIVYNAYGSTIEEAKKMALWRLRNSNSDKSSAPIRIE